MFSIKKRKKPVNPDDIIIEAGKKRKRIIGHAKKIRPQDVAKDCPLCGGNMYYMPDDNEYFCPNCGNSESTNRRK